MESSKSQPTLPTLYFDLEHKKSQPVIAKNENSSVVLPAELLHHCLVQYGDWGDLAKLACVQKGWSPIMMDAAEQDRDSKWELAQALLSGSAGLQQNHTLAFRLLSELAQVETDEHNMPITTTTTNNDDDNDNDNDNNNNSDVTSKEENDSNKNNNNSECFSPAMKALAKCYFEGNGIKQDSKAGVAWLRAAYEYANDADAAHELALCLEYGSHGVENDIFAAAEWFEKAATAGHVEAMAELGLCYELGCGVEQSDTKALDWYMKAANAGHVTSKFSVAEAFEEARGVPQSDAEACLWYYKAAIEGDHDSKMALRRLEEIARIVVPGVTAILDV